MNPSSHPVGTPPPINESQPFESARVSTGAVQFLYELLGHTSGVRVWASAGGAVIRHGGQAYDPYGSPVNYGAALGLGSTFRIAGPLSVELGLTTVTYRMNLRGSEATDLAIRERGTQVDALFHTGVAYSWH